MTNLVTTDDLAARIEWVMEADELRLASGVLEDLSDEARFYGSNTWATPESTPEAVKRLILKAAARYLRNPDGYIQSRAGDETVVWSDKGHEAGVASFSPAEQKVLSQLAGQGGLISVEITAWNSQASADTTGWVPTSITGERAFPLFSEDYE